MKKRLLFILCLFFAGSSAAVSVAAQTKRTVTNQDLEKFRETRLRAERDYRENYAKLGFPSPEELERKRVADGKERAELAEKFRRENSEREKIESEAEYRRAQLNSLQINRINRSYATGGYYGGSYYPGVFVGTYPLYGYSNRYFNNGFGRGIYGGRGNGGFYNSPRVFGQPGIRVSGGSAVRVNIRIGGGRGNGGGRQN